MKNVKPKKVNPNTAPPHEFLRYVDELESYVNKLEKQLTLYSVVRQSELLQCDGCGCYSKKGNRYFLCNKCNKKKY